MSEETQLPEGALEAAQALTEEQPVEAAPEAQEAPVAESAPDWDKLYAEAKTFEDRAEIYEQKQAYLAAQEAKEATESPLSDETQETIEQAHEKTDLQEAVEEVAEVASEEPVEQPLEKQLVAVKIDGEESEVTVEELKRVYQMEQSATKRFQEASEMRKAIDEFNMRLEKDPLGALKAKGIDVDELAQNYIAEKAEYELMTDEQKRIYDLEQKISSAEKEKQLEEQKASQAAFEAEVKELQAHYEKAIPEALEASGFVVNPFTISRVKHYMIEFDAQGFKDVEPEHVMKLVGDELSSIAKSITKSSPKPPKQQKMDKPVRVSEKAKKEAPKELHSEDFEQRANAAFNKYFG